LCLVSIVFWKLLGTVVGLGLPETTTSLNRLPCIGFCGADLNNSMSTTSNLLVIGLVIADLFSPVVSIILLPKYLLGCTVIRVILPIRYPGVFKDDDVTLVNHIIYYKKIMNRKTGLDLLKTNLPKLI
jgi:hypothetical protein